VKLDATIAYLDNGEAVVSLSDEFREWQGGGLVACRSMHHADLYEIGYTFSSVTAAAKGGRLETFREIS
jgi:hypothetical protein